MFNRATLRCGSQHYRHMSKSRKRIPSGTWTLCKSRKKGKQLSHRRFRRYEHVAVASKREDSLPYRQIELTCPWDLGGDGKWCYWGILDDEMKRYIRK